MDATVWLRNALLKKLALQTKAPEILEIVKQQWQETIDSQISPALAPKTVLQKERKNYSEPLTPLKASGDLYDGLALGEVTENGIKIIYKSKVNPAWHRSNYRAKGVPMRDPLSDLSGLFAKIKKVMFGG